MQNLRRSIALSTTLFLLSALPVFAALPSVDVPSECAVADTDAVTHTYAGNYLGICALEAARTQGVVSAYTLQNFSFGLFLQSLNGIAPGATEFWALYRNGVEASVGLTELVVAQGDTITFKLTDFTSNTQVGSPVEFSIGSLIATTNAPSPPPSGGGGEYLKGRVFDVSAAFVFLAKNQNSDGSFASALLTDWAAIAFGAGNDAVCNDACKEARQKLRLHLLGAKPELSSVTDYERHAMALMALGINPYVESPRDYIAPIVSAFDGTQVGDVSLVNDDIFAIFPLHNAGYAKTDTMMEAIISFIIFRQRVNGSWEESVDLTAAAIQALELFPAHAGAADSIEKAEKFLRRNQDDSGIFGLNGFSLGWVLQAIATLQQTPDDWKKSGITPFGYLGVLQQEDGGVQPMSAGTDARVWATSYGVPGALAKPWDIILGDFARPMFFEPVATSTDAVATTSPTQSTPRVLAKANVPAAPVLPASVPGSATTTYSTTTGQLAAAAEPTNSSDGTWVWFSGLLLILFGVYVFLRPA